MLRLVFIFLLFEPNLSEKGKPADLTNEQIIRKIEALEEKYSKEITSFKDEHRKDITSLKNEHIKGITSLKDDHRKDITTLKNEHIKGIASLKDDYSKGITGWKNEHMKEITNLKIEHRNEITSLKDEVEALRKMTENGHHRHGVRTLAGHRVERVAFDAHLSGWVGNLGRNQPIVFPFVNTNIGNLYNNATGVFYCDMSGTYVFFARFLVVSGKSIYLEIVKNGGVVSHIYAYNPHALGQSAATAVTHLQRGDSVWVRTNIYQSTDLNGDILDKSYNSFGGFLLYSD